MHFTRFMMHKYNMHTPRLGEEDVVYAERRDTEVFIPIL